MAKKSSVSGFPEWLPQGRIVEQYVLDHLRKTFELHGFSGVETRAVEPLEELQRKGETSKEVYVLHRLQEEDSSGAGTGLGLHFDLTVPFARYVLQNSGKLTFPFKRYQIQKVWRGERPQEGRFREFTQADIDIVGDGTLAFHHEIEVALVMVQALNGLPIPGFTILVNNRKLLQGACELFGVSNIEDALRGLDKLDKIGPEQVRKELCAAGITESAAENLLTFAQIKTGDSVKLRSELSTMLGEASTELPGLAEVCALLDAGAKRAPGQIVADLKIARGLDYYTGMVYEAVIDDYPALGSICSGGRYDSLASDGKRTYPGVGLSIGVSRLVSKMLSVPMVKVSRSVPTVVLVAVTDEEHRQESEDVADILRSRGICTEVSPAASKFGKQIKYADRRGIPFVWFPGHPHSVKDIRSGEQLETDPENWEISAMDLQPKIEPVL